jgi:hypothetical protein
MAARLKAPLSHLCNIQQPLTKLLMVSGLVHTTQQQFYSQLAELALCTQLILEVVQ